MASIKEPGRRSGLFPRQSPCGVPHMKIFDQIFFHTVEESVGIRRKLDRAELRVVMHPWRARRPSAMRGKSVEIGQHFVRVDELYQRL
jgi:hypothetical protein